MAGPERIAAVMRNRQAAQERRSGFAAAFRKQLLAELGGNPSATQLALVDAAVSAHVEIQELSSLFLRCFTSEEQMARLGLARGQLARILKALGLPKEPADADPGQSLENYITSREKAKAAQE